MDKPLADKADSKVADIVADKEAVGKVADGALAEYVLNIQDKKPFHLQILCRNAYNFS